jgi:hypothetical protein
MAQIFHRSTNALARITIFGGIFILGVVWWAGYRWTRSSYMTGQTVTLKQPIPFSHDHHTAALGIDCRYCHTSVEESSFAGIPPTATCMNCHNIIWQDSPMLEPVRESYRTKTPIRWQRVHDVPDFVYFNHSIHLAKGIGCESCHGRVDRMPLIFQAKSLQMDWCLGCHRDPGRYVRPRKEIVTMGWTPPEGQDAVAAKLLEEYSVESLVSCDTCHR